MRKVDVAGLVMGLDNALVVDVRSPSEFAHARVPGAVSFPLFSDAQRAEIGTLYKQRGRGAAMLQALDYYSPNMKAVIGNLEKELKQRKQAGVNPNIVVQCWRGGMRSGVACWMLDLFGYDVTQLHGGYKQFRRWALDQIEQPRNVVILGGRTGAAKTEVLHGMQQLNQQTIDLEALACHRGSAFGGIGQPDAPSQEQFENELALRLFRLDPHQAAWLEDESQRLGAMNVPNALWKRMREATVYYLDVPFEARLQRLVETYGKHPVQSLVEATARIRKKLGGLQTQQTLECLNGNDIAGAFRILLAHYDKAYDEATAKRDSKTIVRIATETTDPAVNAKLILSAVTNDR